MRTITNDNYTAWWKESKPFFENIIKDCQLLTRQASELVTRY